MDFIGINAFGGCQKLRGNKGYLRNRRRRDFRTDCAGSRPVGRFVSFFAIMDHIFFLCILLFLVTFNSMRSVCSSKKKRRGRFSTQSSEGRTTHFGPKFILFSDILWKHAIADLQGVPPCWRRKSQFYRISKKIAKKTRKKRQKTSISLLEQAKNLGILAKNGQKSVQKRGQKKSAHGILTKNLRNGKSGFFGRKNSLIRGGAFFFR